MTKLFGAIESIRLFLLIFVIYSLPSNLYSAEPDLSSHFIENKGQWSPEVCFLAKINGMNTWITTYGVVYDFYKIEYDENNAFDSLGNAEPIDPMEEDIEIAHRKGHVVKMLFEDSGQNIEFIGNGKSPTYYNYFIGRDSTKWASYVPLYKEVIVKNVYEGIDCRFYFDNGLIRYDFNLQPLADLVNIKMRYEGQDDLKINDNNELILSLNIGKIEHKSLVAYQDNEEIKCSFKIYDNDLIGFKTGNYNKYLALTIDPLVFSTYLGGSGNETIYRSGDPYNEQNFDIDDNDNMYITCGTTSDNYPVTIGAYDDLRNLNDAVVSKLNSDATALIFSTFLGGDLSDAGRAITMDDQYNVYVAGVTFGTDFPLTNGVFYDTVTRSEYTFIVKLNPQGSDLLYSTYLQGFRVTTDIEVDSEYNAYVTTASFGITTANAYRTNGGGFGIYKLNPDATDLEFGTYMFGNGSNCIYDMCLDANNDIFMVGRVGNLQSPTTPGAYDESHNGDVDVFVCKLSNDGSTLLLGTVIGSAQGDYGTSIALDNSGNVYITGFSQSPNYPVTGGVYNESYNGGDWDSFVSVFNPDLSQLLYSTYIGGTDNDLSYAINVDDSANVYISGYTLSSDFPTTSGAYSESNFGQEDVFIVKLVPDLSQLFYSTYFGESGRDFLTDMVIDNDDNIVVAGLTYDIPITPGVFQENRGGLSDLYISKMNLNVLIAGSLGGTTFCVGDIIDIPYLFSITYNPGNWFFAELSDANGDFDNPVRLDSVQSTSIGTFQNVQLPDTLTEGTSYRIRIVSTDPPMNGGDNGQDITIGQLPVPDITFYPNPVCTGNQYSYTCNATAGIDNKWSVSSGTISGPDDGGTVDVIWGSGSSGTVTLVQTNATTGCADSVYRTISINPLPTPVISGTNEFCRGEIIQFSSNIASGYQWKTNSGTITGPDDLRTVDVFWDTEGSSTVTLIQTTSAWCQDSVDYVVTINPTPAPTLVQSPEYVCEFNTYTYISNTDPDVSYFWEVDGGFIESGLDSASSITLTWGEAQTGTLKLIQTNINTNCVDSLVEFITINPLPNVKIEGQSVAAWNEVAEYSSIKFESDGFSNEWKEIGGEIQGGRNTDSTVNILWTDLGMGLLTLIQTDLSTGCIDSTLLDINVITNPSPTITAINTACENNECTYSATKWHTLRYEWSATGGEVISQNEETDTVIVRWGEAGTGTLKLVQCNTKLNLSDSTEIDVNIHPLPNPEINEVVDSVYEDGTMIYSANNLTDTFIFWRSEGGDIIGEDNIDSVEIQWGETGIGKIWLIAEDNTTGCRDSVFLDINIIGRPSLKIQGDWEVCEKDAAIYITHQIEGAENTWIVEGGKIADSSNTQIEIAWDDAGTGIIKLKQFNAIMGNSLDSNDIEVTINSLPNVFLSPFPDFCLKDTLCQLTGGAPPGGAYEIDSIPMTQLNPMDIGIGIHFIKYSFTDGNGCANYEEQVFEIQQIPDIPSIRENGDSLIASPGEMFLWFLNDTIIPEATDSIYIPEEDGIYTVKALTNIGCESGLSETHYYPENAEGPIISVKSSMNYGTIRCENVKNDTLVVQNPGSETLYITNAEISGLDKDDFVFQPGFIPTDILSKGRQNFVIEFKPQTSGDKQAVVTFESNAGNDPDFEVQLNAEKFSIGFELSTDTLKFENMAENNMLIKNIEIINTGDIPLEWPNTAIIDKDFELISVSPNPTMPFGDSSVARILFNGGEDGYCATSHLELSEDSCNNKRTLTICANVGDPSKQCYAVLKIDSIQQKYKPGEIVTIPIYLYEYGNIAAFLGTIFTFDLEFNATLLRPVLGTKTGDVINGQRIIPIDVFRVNPDTNNVIKTIYLKAALGNDTSTVIAFKNLKCYDDSVKITMSAIDGVFSLKGVCKEDGYPRLISNTGKTQLMLLSPNPSSESCELEYELIEKGSTKIYICNTYGEIVKTVLYSETTQPGKSELSINTSDLSTGMYFVILQTPTIRKAVKMEVVK
ncbi:SBBP repeat-containing protein [Bacteroidota bacterium]